MGARLVISPLTGKHWFTCGTRGRSEALLERVENYARRERLWFDPQAEPCYDQIVELNLGDVEWSLAGPSRPQDRVSLGDAPAGLSNLRDTHAASGAMPIAIAAITSCTNTSDPRLLIMAGLLAQKARALGLTVPEWVKTSLAPGSPAAETYLRRAGLMDDLEALGFFIVGYGCTTCIGNSGPLAPALDERLSAHSGVPVAIASGNRNFPGRIHARIAAAYLASPPLVVAYALAGDFRHNLMRDPIGVAKDGREVFLRDLWPSSDEVDHCLMSVDAADFGRAFAAARANPDWEALEASVDILHHWEPASTYLRPPPFVDPRGKTRLGQYSAWPLLVLPDDVTTDHISPAGLIPADAEVADYLVELGERRDDLNTYASRRGNWEVMLRGLFTNPAVRNLLAPGIPAGFTVHQPSGETMPIWRAAQRYIEQGESSVIVAGARYGMGSSRDWAAKGVHMLGVRAVIAVGFERIHRANLINMGVLPLVLPPGVTPASMGLAPGDRITVEAPVDHVAKGMSVPVTIERQGRDKLTIMTTAAIETATEARMLREGGLLPDLVRFYLRDGQARFGGDRAEVVPQAIGSA